MIFVFGSNLSGAHLAGAAQTAAEHHGAMVGMAEGLQGNSYAIPTKAANWRFSLAISEIKTFVDRFLQFASEHPHLTFQVTRIGCGYAGFRGNQIAPLFQDAPPNCLFDSKWAKYLPNKQFWGTF
jgi:hypothetical protein